MAAVTHETKASDIAKSLTMTVTITGMATFRWRLRLVRVLLAVAGWISPIKVDVIEVP